MRMSQFGRRCGAALLTAAILVSPASATIIGGAVTGGSALTAGGVFQKLTTPLSNPFGPANSVGDDNFDSPNLFGFDEGQNLNSGPSALNFNVGPSGPGVVPAHSTVASHYIFFDPGPTTTNIGTVEFDSDIFGIMTTTANMNASDFLSAASVNYLNPSLRGLEAGDVVTLLGPRTIQIDFAASTPGDYIRVLTEFSPGAVPVPESSTHVLVATGLFALALYGWRRKRATSAVKPAGRNPTKSPSPDGLVLNRNDAERSLVRLPHTPPRRP